MTDLSQDQLHILIRLQEVETETTQVKSRLAEAPGRIQALEKELQVLEAGLENRQAELQTLQKQYRDFEAETQMIFASIKKSEEKLRTVKTNKEYKASLQEIEDLKTRNSDMEDEMLLHLERMEQLESGLVRQRQESEQRAEAIRRQQERIRQESRDDQGRLRELEDKAGQIAVQMSDNLMQRFRTVKEAVGGLVIAPVCNATCQGCNMNIPPQMYNELQRGDKLHFCPNCQRIIYWSRDGSETG